MALVFSTGPAYVARGESTATAVESASTHQNCHEPMYVTVREIETPSKNITVTDEDNYVDDGSQELLWCLGDGIDRECGTGNYNTQTDANWTTSDWTCNADYVGSGDDASFLCLQAAAEVPSYSSRIQPYMRTKPPRGKRHQLMARQQIHMQPQQPAYVLRTMPPATENEWKRRTEHRQTAVDYIKTTGTYQKYKREKDAGRAGNSDPVTPDSLNRSLSKRDWEKSVQLWRRQLRAW